MYIIIYIQTTLYQYRFQFLYVIHYIYNILYIDHKVSLHLFNCFAYITMSCAKYTTCNNVFTHALKIIGSIREKSSNKFSF